MFIKYSGRDGISIVNNVFCIMIHDGLTAAAAAVTGFLLILMIDD